MNGLSTLRVIQAKTQQAILPLSPRFLSEAYHADETAATPPFTRLLYQQAMGVSGHSPNMLSVGAWRHGVFAGVDAQWACIHIKQKVAVSDLFNIC